MSIVVVAALSACGGKKEQAPAATGSAAPVAAGSGSAGSAASPDGSAAGSAAVAEAPLDVPTEVDFEELAASEITDKNLESQLTSIETELAE